ncbi:tRNA pseudouridine synthase [Obba rivulosa]|uniref:tRNA pseudouridine synthase n=1 Tax=Obba rivulosa TaxID=1052685 RepID=A0A8E2AVM9_9APHY|nr:tRNA pseudouridine synthase [Obba rivulosa]
MPNGYSLRFLRLGYFSRIMSGSTSYDSWTREELIARLRHVDVHSQKPNAAPKPLRHVQKPFDFSAHPRRKIALRFSYNGSEYGGLEAQKTPTPLPTVEGVLYEALVHTKLIDPSGGMEGCGWEKCGRTDKGVSAAGQVISLWVRSALGEAKTDADTEAVTSTVTESSITEASQPLAAAENVTGLDGDLALMGDWDEPPTSNSLPPPTKPATELNYVALLNNVLPLTVRINAWSPVAPDFSARFSCRYRHYKYFFTPHGLDLDAMRDAASRLVGEHDFRNLCKVDPQKQLTSFVRRILSAEINPATPQKDDIYVLDLKGYAFLYNQVRHIMAILFLVGTRLEHPSVVDALLNVDPANPKPPSRENESPPPVVESKPEYQMAQPFPLMLWDCGYDPAVVQWQGGPGGVDTNGGVSTPKQASGNLYEQLHSLYERSLVQTALDLHFLRAAEPFHAPPPQYLPVGHPDSAPIAQNTTLSIPTGAGAYSRTSSYVPLLQRKRGDLPDVINERWRLGKGAKRIAARKATTEPDDADE